MKKRITPTAVNGTGEETQGVNNGGHSTDFRNSGFPGNVSSTPNVPTSQILDYNHLLFLSLADISGVNLISFQLLGIENYVVWRGQ